MKKNVILIGMPGAGKSTIGVILAKALGKDFVDADLEIQREEGLLLSEIIERDGPAGFLLTEERVNASLKPENAVVATGGSVVYGERAMEHFMDIGTIVYLRLSYEAVRGRLNDIHGRGVVLREGQTLADIYDERTPLYERYADLIVDEDGLNVEQTLDKILQKLG